MAMDERGLGKKLQEARQAAGLTQQELCQRANLSFSTLTKIERGAIKSPSIFTVQAIATSLNVSLDQLIGHSAGSTANGQTKKKTKSGVSFVYFDVNGCLVHFYQRAFSLLSQTTGAPLDVVESAYWHYNDDVCRGIMTINDFNAKLADRLSVDKVDWQKYYLETVEPIKQMHETVKWASQNYRIGLLTNIMPGLLSSMRRNQQVPDLAYDSIIDSSEVAAIKPEAKMYEIAQERAGVPAHEILLIDDSRVNLMAAERIGWHVLWFDDSRPDEASERVRSALEAA
jgi:FMN phosphatase YigB (HAD superfamily)/DNA-binding XRE family transcriptional regulator